jgi:hypothetical protein
MDNGLSPKSRKILKPLKLMSEAQEQTVLVNWAKWNRLRLISVPNEGPRSAHHGKKLVRMGLSRGFPDLMLLRANLTHHGLFLEMKQNRDYTKAEKSAPHWLEQEEWIKYLNDEGYYATFAFGWQNGMQIINSYLKGIP